MFEGKGFRLPARIDLDATDFGWAEGEDRRGKLLPDQDQVLVYESPDPQQTLEEFLSRSAIYAGLNQILFGLRDATPEEIRVTYRPGEDVKQWNVW
jgi:hypothetical protein